MTKREFLMAIVESEMAQEMKDFARKEIELLDKKNEKAKNRLTKAQRENMQLQNIMLSILTEHKGEPLTINNVIMELEERNCIDITNQKISSLMKKIMQDNENIEKVEVKVEKKNRVAYKLN